MLTLLLALTTITASVGRFRSSRKRRLAFSDRTGMLAAYVADFREFVRGIEGAIPEDVELALKHLEAIEKRGALREKLPDMPALPAPGSRLPVASPKQFIVICDDLRAMVFDQRLDVLREWAKRYSFTTAMRVEVMRILDCDDRPSARKFMQIAD